MYYPPGGILLWIFIFLDLITFGMALVAMLYSANEEFEDFKNITVITTDDIKEVFKLSKTKISYDFLYDKNVLEALVMKNEALKIAKRINTKYDICHKIRYGTRLPLPK